MIYTKEEVMHALMQMSDDDFHTECDKVGWHIDNENSRWCPLFFDGVMFVSFPAQRQEHWMYIANIDANELIDDAKRARVL